MKLISFTFLLLLISGSLFAQQSLPQNYFKSPLDIPLYLAGNFGELRSDHFHAGLDLKTQQVIGLEVTASADGYVSRIKKSTYGYGNVLYVQHPNGYTTVYGHLEEFAPKIRDFVKQKMYAQEKNTIELFPDKKDLPVKQGEVIALSGESGGAAGPHVHFEIRDAQQRPMNPLMFGFDKLIADHKPPHVFELFAYPQNNDSHVNKSAKRQQIHIYKQKDGSYKSKPIKAYGKIGFGVRSLDYMDGSHNTDGLFEIKTSLNGKPKLDLTFDCMSFAKTRYINRYIDYAYYKKHKRRIQKLFIQKNNHIDISVNAVDDGYAIIKDSLNFKYEIILKDFAGNKTIVRVPIIYNPLEKSEIKPQEIDSTAYYAKWNRPSVFDLAHHDVYIPSGALYEDTFLDLEDDYEKVKVHHYTTPLQTNITIGFDASQYSKEDREKLYVARVYPWGAKYYSPTYKDGNRITTKTRIFGTYELAFDKTPPTVEPVNFYDKKWMSNARYLKLKIDDSESGISSYRGTINGKFIVLEYDYKNHTIRYDFKDNVSNDVKNDLKIIVVDNVGNSTTFEAEFFRKA